MQKRMYRSGYPHACIFLVFFLMLSFTRLSAQLPERKISLPKHEMLVKEVLTVVEQELSLQFSYGKEVAEGLNKKLSFKVTSLNLKQILETIRNGTGISWAMADKGVIILKAGNRSERPSKPIDQGKSIHINGKVTSASTGSVVSGATISVKGGGVAGLSEADGSFSIQAGEKATLLISHIAYSQKEVPVNGQSTITIVLQAEQKQLEEVLVMTRRKMDNENALLNARKKASAISDGISARNIEKTASITTTQALQRVTGVTITDEKYVAIRGLGDRSVIAELNGARLSSSDPDRTAVPLDLVPAGLLDNITVYKSLTPDKPADASAGIIELKTKSVPDSMVLSFVVESGFNSTIGLGGRYNAFRNSDPGFFGQKVKEHNLSPDFLRLKEQYPGGRKEIQRLFIDSRSSPQLTAEAGRINDLMLGLDPVVTTIYQKAKPNQLYNIMFGNTWRVWGNRALGLILGANYYHRTEDRYQADLNQWSIYQGLLTGTDIYSKLHIPNFISPDNINLGKYLTYKENTGIEKLNYGALAGLTFQVDKNNEIGVQYMASRGAEVSGTNLIGEYTNTGLTAKVYNNLFGLKQAYRVFNTLNLMGEHKLGNKIATRISWAYSDSRSSQNEPDYRFVNLVNRKDMRFIDQNGVGIGDDSYGMVVGLVHGIGPAGAILADPNGRRFRKLNENNVNYKIDITQPFYLLGQKQEFKAGYNYLKRTRDFTENILGLPKNYDILSKYDGNPDALVAYTNIGLKDPAGYNDEGQQRVGGFLYEIRKSPNNYTGYYKTGAFYGMLDLRLQKNWRLTGGVRFESTDIQASVDTANVAKDNFIDPALLVPPGSPPGFGGVPQNTYVAVNPRTGYKTDYKPYYSANLTYTYRLDMNFRLAFSTSLARPELREITNLYQFDPFQFAVVGGNPDLVNQSTKSLDFRWEWFPAPGEVIAASLFGKQIDNQLTKVFILNSGGNNAYAQEYSIVKFVNDPEQGKVYGIELELRKNLGSLWRPMRNFFIGSNAMLAASEIKKNPERLLASRIIDRRAPATSPLFEQAPYTVNAYLDYDNPRSGSNITLSYNVVGERLIQVQLDGTPDIYDRPASILDLVFSQRLLKRFVIKGFIKNLLNPAFREVYTQPGNKGFYHGMQYIRHQYYKGTEYLLGITYNIF